MNLEIVAENEELVGFKLHIVEEWLFDPTKEKKYVVTETNSDSKVKEYESFGKLKQIIIIILDHSYCIKMYTPFEYTTTKILSRVLFNWL